MDIEAIRLRMEEIQTRIEELNAEEELTDETRAEWDELNTEFAGLVEASKREQTRSQIAAHVAALPEKAALSSGDNSDLDRDVFGSEDPDTPGAIKNPFDLNALRTANLSELRSRALSAVEQANGFTTRDREILTGFVEELDEEDGVDSIRMARHIVATSGPDYVRAWRRALKTGVKAGAPDPEAVQVLTRAMSLTTTEGGFAVPTQLDPALILTSDGSTNPIRQISRVVQATGDTWTGLSTTHAGWSNDDEAEEVSDDATVFAQPSITVFKAQVFIPFSIEIQMDYPGFTQDLRTIIANGKDDLDATNFATGSGTLQPVGIVTALTGTASEIDSAATDTFAVADVYGLETALPAKYLSRAQWAANKHWYNRVRQFDTGGGAAMWERIGASQPSELIGYPAHVASAMDNNLDTSAENRCLILGDWVNYVIADRIGMTLELVPHLFATPNNRPAGQRGLYGFARTGADSVNDGGFRMLNVT
jgi:HK97 family phage major capsid protein